MEVRLNNKLYLQAEEIVRLHPEAFKEGKKKPRQILQFKRIPPDEYIFGSCVKAGWRVSNEQNNKAKLLITKTWLDEFLKSFNPPVQEPAQEVRPIVSEIKEAPPILDLMESEKFKDHNGKVLEIEVRGEREEDECFFRVKDVAVCFNDIHLYRNIDRADIQHTSYRINEDFVYFYRISNRHMTEADVRKPAELFFTYQGVLRYLFVSQNPNSQAFRKWASKILFAMQMGTAEQKESVGAELFGVSPEVVSKFFGTCCVRDIPMAYLLKLSEALESMKIPYGDHRDWLVVKPGQHGKEERKTGVVGRLKGHKQEFKEFRDTMEYMHFVFVDPMYVSDVEARIKNYFSEFRLDYGSKSEVFLIHKSRLDGMKEFFRQLSIEYSGNHADIQRAWDQYRNDTKARMHDMEVENRHLNEMMETLTVKTQTIIDNLQERIAEQAETIRTHVATIKAFITRFMSS